jgi:hypothetical protein
VFGQSFVAADVVAYALGAALASAIDVRLSPARPATEASGATSAGRAG